MRSIGLTRATTRASALLVALLLVGGCGNGEGGDGALPTFSPTRTPTATLPSELPSPTRSPTRTGRPDETTPTEPEETTPTEPEETTPTEPDETTPTEPDDATPTEPDRTTPTEPAETTPVEPEDSTTESPAPEASEPDEETSDEDDGVASWVWWLLGALAVGISVAIPLLVRNRRRNAWRGDLEEAEAEVAWFATELLPALRQVGSREEVAGGWAVGQARVAAAEDRLTVLESTAPDDAGRQRARSLRDACRIARRRMNQISDPGAHDTWALDLDAVIADLDVALGSGGPAPRTQ